MKEEMRFVYVLNVYESELNNLLMFYIFPFLLTTQSSNENMKNSSFCEHL
jgi:hypothetical protein